MTTKNRKFKRTTQDQLHYYMQFCSQHPRLHGRVFGMQAKYENKKLWRELAANLNALRGPTRSVVKWKENLSQRKNQIRCRARKERAALLKAGGVGFLEPDEAEIFRQHICHDQPHMPDNVNILPCIQGLGPQNTNGVPYRATVINGMDLDSDFPAEVKLEPVEEAYISEEALIAAASRPDTPPMPTLSPKPTANTPPTFSSNAASRKRVTLDTIHTTLLEGMKIREEAAQRSAELQQQTVTALQNMGQSLQSISDSLKKLNERFDMLQ